MTTTDDVLYTVTGRVATMTINRPQKKNAISSGVISGLRRSIDRATDDAGVGALVLRGAGGNFCAGADLGGGLVGETSPSFLELHEGRGAYAGILLAMMDCPKPILAAVEGYCLAGGVGLCLAADLAIAHRDAKFGLPEIKRGLWPYMVTALLIRNVGRKQALELCMIGDRISAERAAAAGLVNHAVGAGAFEEKVSETAARLASFSPAIMGLGKRSFYGIADMTTRDALRFLQSQLTVNANTEDVVEGITAFFEKRDPDWKGK